MIELRGRTRENALSAEALASMGITAESVAQKLTSTHRGWLCEEDGRLAGFAMGDTSTGELWVIAVAPEFEGRGIGSNLLASVEQWLWESGCPALWLWTDADESRRAYAFYLRHGWQKTEVRNGALYMRKKKSRSAPEGVTFREVETSDLATFHAQQPDPEAIRMAAFVGKDRKDKAAFDAHWAKILSSSQNINRTIVAGGQIAGHIACYPNGENLEVTYRLGREFWGRGLATQALDQMLQLVVARPITARAATDNFGSLRVLQKCGFKIIGQDKGFAQGRGEDTEEYLLRLDLDHANE